MKDQPPAMSTLQSLSPPALDHVVRRCLVKEPDGRWQSATDLMSELNWIAEAGSDAGVSVPVAAAPKATGWRLSIGTAVAAALLLSGIVAVAVWSLRPESARPLVRFVATTPSFPPFVNSTDVEVAITPDGTRIVYPVNLDGQRQLVVRALDQLEVTPLAGLGTVRGPFISPDGNWVGYFEGGALRKVSILGGPPVTICELPGGAPRGASWGTDDSIIFATTAPSGLWRVPAGGGEPEELTTPVDPEQGDHLWPEILPGGEAVLFTIMLPSAANISPPPDKVTLDEGGSVENAQIAVLSLVTGEIEVLVPGGSNPRYAPTGHIVYGVGGTLRAVPFDPDGLELTGNAVPVVDGVITKQTGAANFALAQDDGTLVYLPGVAGGAQRTLVWVDREGREEPLGLSAAGYGWAHVSPDGLRVAVSFSGPEGQQDVWISELARGTLSRVTTDSAIDNDPVWTPDGQRVVFPSWREGGGFGFYSKAADGTGPVELLLMSETSGFFRPYGWSPDGKALVFDYGTSDAQGNIGMLSMEGDRPWEPLFQTEAHEVSPAISPDGAWIAYTSDQTGQVEVYMERFPDLGDRRQISTDGGGEPLWSPDGRELFYRRGDAMMVVAIGGDPTSLVGSPEVLFEGPYWTQGTGSRRYDIAPDGQRFLMIKQGGGSDDTAAPPSIVVVQNWFEELKRLVPTN